MFHFKDPVNLKAEENTEVVLNFMKTGSGGSYEEIDWSKDQTGSSHYKIVFLRPGINGGVPLYYDEYCSGTGTCNTSTKVELKVHTGELI